MEYILLFAFTLLIRLFLRERKIRLFLYILYAFSVVKFSIFKKKYVL